MADILMHLPADDRHKFQQMMIDARCSAVLRRKGFRNKRCKICNKSIDRTPALLVSSHDFCVGIHICNGRECVFQTPTIFAALRQKYLDEARKETPLWVPGDPVPSLEDLKL